MRAHTVHPFFTFHPDRLRSWLAGLAQLADPKLALASLVPFCAGAAIAFDQRGSIDAGLAASAYLAIFLIEIGKNAVHDLYNPRTSNRPRLLDDQDLINIGWGSFAGAAVVGTFVVAESSPALLLLAAFAAAVAAAYSIPPVSLAKRGFGELAICTVYGPGIVLGSLLMLRGTINAEAVIVAVTLGILMAAAVLVTEIAEEREDALAGRRTSVTRLGSDRATSFVSLSFIIAFALPIVWGVYAGPFRLTAVFAGIPCAIFASSALDRQPDGYRDAAQVWALATYALTGVALSAAIALL